MPGRAWISVLIGLGKDPQLSWQIDMLQKITFDIAYEPMHLALQLEDATLLAIELVIETNSTTNMITVEMEIAISFC
jgi:hypothetical protein